MLINRSATVTCLCRAFAVEHLQDVFGYFLDGVSSLVSQLAYAIQYH